MTLTLMMYWKISQDRKSSIASKDANEGKNDRL